MARMSSWLQVGRCRVYGLGLGVSGLELCDLVVEGLD